MSMPRDVSFCAKLTTILIHNFRPVFQSSVYFVLLTPLQTVVKRTLSVFIFAIHIVYSTDVLQPFIILF